MSMPGSCGNAQPSLCVLILSKVLLGQLAPSGEGEMSDGEEGSVAGGGSRYPHGISGRAVWQSWELDFHLDGVRGCRGELCRESG